MMTTNTMTHHAPLHAGEYLVSNNRRFFAILQTDGNFCVYRGSGPADNQGLCWAADNPTGAFCDLNMWLQAEDGNLVTYASLTPGGEANAIWATNVQTGPGNYYAVMQDDGYFCQYAGVPAAEGANNMGTAQALWHTQYVFGKWMPPGSAIVGGTPAETMPIPWRAITLAGVGAIPKVGAVLKGITEKIWTQGSVWDQVKQQVQAMIDQAIATTVLEELTAEMDGLKAVYKNYLDKCDDFNALTEPPDSDMAKDVRNQMSSQYTVTKNYFDANVRKFMLATHAVPTMQLMAAVATMHLAIYRDGLIHGASWGMIPSDLKRMGEDLRGETGLIATYCNWVDSWVPTALPPKPAAATMRTLQDTYAVCGQWLARNSYIRLMTLNVLDVRALWPYVDTAVCPAGQVPPKLTREILSDGFGYFDPTLPVDPPHMPSWRTTTLPAPEAPPKRLTHLAIDGAGYINGVTVSYDGGAPETREGSPFQGQITLPFGWAGYISAENPIVNVSVSTTGDWSTIDLPDGGFGDLSTMMLVFKDGTSSGLMGNAAKVMGLGSAQFPGHVLSSIYLTADGFYANGVVFGFRLADCWD